MKCREYLWSVPSHMRRQRHAGHRNAAATHILTTRFQQFAPKTEQRLCAPGDGQIPIKRLTLREPPAAGSRHTDARKHCGHPGSRPSGKGSLERQQR